MPSNEQHFIHPHWEERARYRKQIEEYYYSKGLGWNKVHAIIDKKMRKWHIGKKFSKA